MFLRNYKLMMPTGIKIKGSTLLLSMAMFLQVKAQEKEKETLGTETVVIVKAYTPAISDAYKIKPVPNLKDSLVLAKKKVEYQINSVPVASTFTPAKGKAAKVEKTKREKLYDNYATLGVGNYTSVLAELYSAFALNRTDNLGVALQHNSSQGGIEGVPLDHQYYDTDFHLNFASRLRDVNYGMALGVTHQVYNWYGLPSDLLLTKEQVNDIAPLQTYLGLSLEGYIEFEDAIFNEVRGHIRHFRDDFKSAENHVVIKPEFEFPVGDEVVTGRVILDYVGGRFDRDLDIGLGIKNEYSTLNLGFHPSFDIISDELSINVGAAAYLSIDVKNSKNRLFVYPQIEATYRLADEYAIAYGGVVGGLVQNTYYKAVQENPFVAPTLTITPTDQQYDAYLGLKGKLANSVGYMLEGGYAVAKNKPLFLKNEGNLEATAAAPQAAYDYGNSFGYVYDDVNTISATAGVHIDIKSKFKLGVEGTLFGYATQTQQEAWNLPQFQAAITANYQMTAQWYAAAQLYFVGERQALFSPIAPAEEPISILVLAPYFDANVTLGYRHNDQLSFFVKGHNLGGENYQKWLDYPVLGTQVLGGITYKFDF